MKQLKFYGLGGQGVVTAAKILSVAVSIHEGRYAITVPAYGHERRGAPVYTDVMVDQKPIQVNCFVYEPDIVVVLDEFIVEKHGIDVGRGKERIPSWSSTLPVGRRPGGMPTNSVFRPFIMWTPPR